MLGLPLAQHCANRQGLIGKDEVATGPKGTSQTSWEADRNAMSKSLLEALPGIVAAGRRRAEQILEQLEGRNRVTLQTRELVIPSKDTVQSDLFRSPRITESSLDAPLNRLIYGDNLLAMAALLAGEDDSPSFRGRLDLYT